MADKNKENSILSINGILSGAADENVQKRSASMPDFKAAAEAEIAATATPVKEEPVKAITEEQEIINEYSGKAKTDPNISTNRLREMLAAQSGDNSALMEYFSGGSHRTSKRVQSIYAVLDGKTVTDVPVTPTAPHFTAETPVVSSDGGRLSDEVPEKETFVQESLFGADEESSEELPLGTGERATFDEDFASLSDKIISGEISVETETESVDQMTLGVDEETGESLEISDADAEKDKKLKYLFDMISGEAVPEPPPVAEEDAPLENKSKKVTKKKKKKKKKAEGVAFEYTDRAQNGEIASMLSRAVAISRLKLIGVAVLTFLILYMELGTYTSDRTPFLRPGRYGAIYILTDLQLLFFIVMLMSKSFIDGLKSFASFKLTANSVMAASVVAASTLCLISLFHDATLLDLRLYNLVAAVGATGLALVEHLRCIKDKRAFLLIASKKPKFTTRALSGNTGEAGEFYKYLDESSELFTVNKTDFVTGFFDRTNRRPESEDIFNFLVPISFAAAVALFLVSYLMGASVYDAFSAAVLLFVAAMPLTSFFMISLPVITASFIAHRQKAAFIGNAVAEEYADASVLSFADVEAFRPHLTTISTVKTYSDYPVDKVLTRLGMLFDYIGGPLKTVTANMLDRLPTPDSIRLMDSAADGLYIVMDGCDYYLGKRSYMRHCDFETPDEEEDAAYTRGSSSVMYMAINNTIVAKIYVKYGINAEFDELLRSMHRAGVCVGIKTLDPNINNELLQKNLRYKQCPVAILKNVKPEEMNETADKVGSGIVSVSSLHTFLKMFILCDRARHSTRSNCIINIAATVVAMMAVFFLTLTGAADGYGSGSVVLFHLLWMLPSVAMSFLL